MRKRIIVLLSLFVCLFASGPAQPSAQVQPEIQVVDLEALDSALARYRGQAVLLNFWAIWCEPCLAEMPDLLAVGRDFKGKGGVVLTVSYDLMVPETTPEGVLEKMKAFVAERGIDVPVFIYDGEDYDAINKRFGLPGPVPVTITLDRNGEVVERHPGKSTRADFERMMRKAIG